MAPNSARIASAHLCAWVGWGVAVGVAWQQESTAASFALNAAGAALAVGFTASIPVRLSPARHIALALLVALVIEGLISVDASIASTNERLVLLMLSVGVAGAEVRAVKQAAATDVRAAPPVRPAPTLIAFAIAAAAAAMQLPTVWMLGALVALHAAALVLVAQTRDPGPARAAGAGLRPVLATARDPRAWLILAAAAAAGTILALKPVLSSIGGQPPHQATAAALMLATAGLLGPPLAVVARRAFPKYSVRMLSTIAGACALAAPLARSGIADLAVGMILGVALATILAMAEIARRRQLRFAGGLGVAFPYAAAGGAGLAAFLLAAVPVTDLVLGASMVCLVAAIGVWVPSGAPSGAARPTITASAPPN